MRLRIPRDDLENGMDGGLNGDLRIHGVDVYECN